MQPGIESTIRSPRLDGAASRNRVCVTRARGDRDQSGDRDRSDLVEVFRHHDADADHDEHHAAPGEETQLAVQAHDIASLTRNQRRCSLGGEHTFIAKARQLGFEGEHRGIVVGYRGMK